MKHDNYTDLLSVSDEVRSAVRVTEVTGVRTVFTKEDRRVAILLSWDEYQALAETVRLGGDPERLERIRAGDAELARGGGLPLDDPAIPETARVTAGAAEELRSLPEGDRDAARAALAAIASNAIVGAPLFDPLRGFWVYAEDRVRIVYRVSGDGAMAGVVMIDRTEEAP